MITNYTIVRHNKSPRVHYDVGEVICLREQPTYFGVFSGYSPDRHPHLNFCSLPNLHATLDGWQMCDLHEVRILTHFKIKPKKWYIGQYTFKTELGYFNSPILVMEVDYENNTFFGYAFVSNMVVKVSNLITQLFGEVLKTSNMSTSNVTHFHGGEELPVFSSDEIKSICINVPHDKFLIISE